MIINLQSKRAEVIPLDTKRLLIRCDMNRDNIRRALYSILRENEWAFEYIESIEAQVKELKKLS